MKRIMALVAGLALTATAHAQTDIAGSFYKTFTQSTSGNGITQAAKDSAGGMFELRHIQTPWIGYEFAYSLNPNNQTLAPVTGACDFYCNNTPETISVKDHRFTLDWIVSRQYGHLRPFLVGGLGFTVAIPAGAYGSDLNTVVRPTYVYGGGTDWAFGSKAGIRVQYRGNLYKAPDVDPTYPATGSFTQDADPMIGIFFRL